MALSRQQQRLFGKIIRWITYRVTTIDQADVDALITVAMVRYQSDGVVVATPPARLGYYIGHEEGAMGL